MDAMDDRWKATLQFVLVDGSLLVGLFLLITMIVLLVQQLPVGKRLQKGLKNHSIWRGATLAAVGGAVTPFCSCSTVPVLNGMLKAGFPMAVSFTFLVASPVINEGVILLLALSTGATAVTGYLLLAAGLSMMAGMLVHQMKLDQFVRVKPAKPVLAGEGVNLANQGRLSLPESLKLAWFGALAELRNLGPWLALGIGVGALIYGQVPTEWFTHLFQWFPGWVLIPLAALAAAPLYVSPAAALPVGFALVERGMDIGPVIAFLVAGAGVSLPEMILLGRMFRWPLMLAHIGTVILTAMVLGFTTNWLFQDGI